ncbi:MAG TPA: hypothetical protein VGM01_01605, partial [Ktedonobacteraceae bacterium]
DLGDWDSWDQLDSSDLRKLDPEGLSLIAFDYISPNAHYIFHLPFRIAEAFVPFEQITLLKSTPWTSRESGEYYGRTVTEAESLRQPIADILHKLGADIPAICPRQLCDKEQDLIARYTEWYDENENDEDDDDDEDEVEQRVLYWQNIIRSGLSATWREPNACPCCSTPVEPVPGLTRVEHWQQEHPGQDLTISQASWLMDYSGSKKVFCQQYPPDYRAPHERGWGTRYWKVETLKAWVNEKGEL